MLKRLAPRKPRTLRVRRQRRRPRADCPANSPAHGARACRRPPSPSMVTGCGVDPAAVPGLRTGATPSISNPSRLLFPSNRKKGRSCPGDTSPLHPSAPASSPVTAAFRLLALPLEDDDSPFIIPEISRRPPRRRNRSEDRSSASPARGSRPSVVGRFHLPPQSEDDRVGPDCPAAQAGRVAAPARSFRIIPHRRASRVSRSRP